MKDIQRDLEKAQTVNVDLPCSSKNATAKQNTFNKTIHKPTKWDNVQLPNSMVKANSTFDSVDVESQIGEMVLPPVSPVPSLSWSQQDEMISSDTGYNSGFGR